MKIRIDSSDTRGNRTWYDLSVDTDRGDQLNVRALHTDGDTVNVYRVARAGGQGLRRDSKLYAAVVAAVKGFIAG